MLKNGRFAFTQSTVDSKGGQAVSRFSDLNSSLAGHIYRCTVEPGRHYAVRLPAVLMTVVQALPAFGTSSGLLKV